jgi:proteasome lid subunit RPN8/RPN11
MRTSPLFTSLDLALPEIEKLGRQRAPVEACGLLLDIPRKKPDGTVSAIVELPNRSIDGPGTYRIEPSDIQLALENLEEVEDVAVWHTHPSGFIGPSKGDMENRPELGIYMVVVALTDKGPVATWF